MSKRNKKLSKGSIKNLYHGYRKQTKQKLFKKCKCGNDDEDYLLVIDPETNEIEGGIKMNAKKKSSPTRKKNKIPIKKGGRKRTLKQKKKKRKTKTKKRRKRNKRKKK